MTSKSRILKRAHLISIAAALIVLVGVLGLPVKAQEPFGSPGKVTLSPTSKEIVLSSGLLVAKSEVTIANNTSQNLVADLQLVDLGSLDQSFGLSFSEGGLSSTQYPLAKWMSLPAGNKVSIAPGQKVNVALNIDNKEDLSPGGHYGAVIASFVSGNSGLDNNKVALNQQLVSYFFVKKLGGEKYGLELKSFTADKNNGLPSTVSLKFASTGNVHVVPRGFIRVTDDKNREVAKGIINPESTLILPSVEREFKTTITAVDQSLLKGNGRYKITAYYRHDDQTNFDTASIEVGKRSYTKIILIFTLIIAGLAIILFMLRKKKIFVRRK